MDTKPSEINFFACFHVTGIDVHLLLIFPTKTVLLIQKLTEL